MSRKGISLPINMLVILAVAIVVLLAVVAFFMTSMGGGQKTISQQTINNMCCRKYIDQGKCGDDSFGNLQVTFQGNTYTCSNQPIGSNPDQACGCPQTP